LNEKGRYVTKLTTHVLDTMKGAPAAELRIDLYRIEGGEAQFLSSHKTNSDGRVDSPLLEGHNFMNGTYRLDFHVGDYLAAGGGSDFLNIIPIQFMVSDTARHYHVPLLLSAYGYSTYRGS
jgi:5-hydroxyisourate hydrolase